MKKSTYLIITAVLFFFGLIACQQQSNTAKNAQQSDTAKIAAASPAAVPDIETAIKLFCEQFTKEKSDTGIEWDYQDAVLCFQEYDSVLNQYCFLHDPVRMNNDNRPGQLNTTASRNRRLMPKFRLVTRAETFLGTNMVCWLANHSQLKEDTTDVVTELRMGIYTEEFFRKADPLCKKVAEEEQKKKIDRVTVFIIPYTKNAGKRVDPTKVYDFGGLQP